MRLRELCFRVWISIFLDLWGVVLQIVLFCDLRNLYFELLVFVIIQTLSNELYSGAVGIDLKQGMEELDKLQVLQIPQLFYLCFLKLLELWVRIPKFQLPPFFLQSSSWLPFPIGYSKVQVDNSEFQTCEGWSHRHRTNYCSRVLFLLRSSVSTSTCSWGEES